MQDILFSSPLLALSSDSLNFKPLRQIFKIIICMKRLFHSFIPPSQFEHDMDSPNSTAHYEDPVLHCVQPVL